MARRAAIVVLSSLCRSSSSSRAPFDAFDPRRSHFDSGRAPLLFHFREQRFLHIGGKLQTAVELHLRRVGVDRFRLREIDDRRKNLGRFEDRKIQSRLFRFDRRRNTGDPRADDREIENSLSGLPAFRLPVPRTPSSCKIARTACAPVSEENFSSGIPVRSPTIRTPGWAVTPSGPETGSFSTVPAGHCVCSHFV